MSTVSPGMQNRIRERLGWTTDQRGAKDINVGNLGRWISAAGGAALFLSGLTRRSPLGLALTIAGGSLLHRGVSGYCAVNGLFGINTAHRRSRPEHVSVSAGHGCRVDCTVHVDRSPEETFRFWRNFENLPRIMHHLQSVQETGGRRSHWAARAPLGRTVEWDAEIITERRPELIGWRSLPGSEVDTAGSVHFFPSGSGTDVRIELKYDPPAGKVGSIIARMLGESPQQQIEEDLQRFKRIMESRETAALSQGR